MAANLPKFKCPHCGSTALDENGVKSATRQIVDPVTKKKTVQQVNASISGKCLSCKKRFTIKWSPAENSMAKALKKSATAAKKTTKKAEAEDKPLVIEDYGARCYLQSNGHTVTVVRTVKYKGSPEYSVDLSVFKLAEIDDPTTIGKHVIAAMNR